MREQQQQVNQSLIFKGKLCKFLQPLSVDLLYLDSAASVLPVPLGLEVPTEWSDQLILILIFVVNSGLVLLGRVEAGGFFLVAEVLLCLFVLGSARTLPRKSQVQVLGGGDEAAIEGLSVQYFELGREDEVSVLEMMLKREAVVLAEGKRHRFWKLLIHLFLLKILDLLFQHLYIGSLAFFLLTILLATPEEIETSLANNLPLLHLHTVHIQDPLGLLILLGQRLVDGGVHWMIAVVVLLLEGK